MPNGPFIEAKPSLTRRFLRSGIPASLLAGIIAAACGLASIRAGYAGDQHSAARWHIASIVLLVLAFVVRIGFVVRNKRRELDDHRSR